MKQFSAKIIKNNQICGNFFELTVAPLVTGMVPTPGQFLTIRVDTVTSPLLRRPFAYSDFDKSCGQFSIIYQKRGKATEILTVKQPGDSIDCIGPIGNNFQLPKPGTTAILVAGGIGVGPVQFLASELKKNNTPFTFIFGCRTKNLIPESTLFSSLNPVICTDDGSSGFKGTSVDYLQSIELPKDTVFYCCGPLPMLQACYNIAEQLGNQCWISVEQVMACGVGACMGCVVKVRSAQKYVRACKEGPVFDGNDLDWTT